MASSLASQSVQPQNIHQHFISYSHCPSCASTSIHKALSVKDYTVSNKVFEIWHCDNCSFRFTQNIPVIKEIGTYYQSNAYVSHSDTQEGFINKLYHTIRNYTLQSKRKLIQSSTKKQTGTLLDIGAGTGAFANAMKIAGWEVTGLEPDEKARKNALNKYHLNLLLPETLYHLPKNTFDAITMWHVLEHVHDLHGYMNCFKNILKQDGRLLIAVPNYTSYDAKHYEECWAAYDVPRHLYHFSPKCMQQLMQQYGFIIEAYKPMWFDSFYVSMLSEQYKNGRGAIVKAFFNGLISNFNCLFNSQLCSSVIYVLKKN
jgi:2-polyprenyl-3-methyl-5-hydroxy-6-metoxy-1,4-benzoquinol methylase